VAFCQSPNSGCNHCNPAVSSDTSFVANFHACQKEENQYVRIPSSAKGEGISMAKAMSASRLLYWDGNQYQSAQTSD
jgi:hypothetical protein